MARIALVALVAACTGMRPALDRTGPEIAATTGGKVDVVYLGDGCYVAGERIWACSIDSLPAGEQFCALEPNEQWRVTEISRGRYRRGAVEYFYDSNLDSFVDRLNTHRCHARYYDTFAIDPLRLTYRDARMARSPHFVPLAELELSALPSELAVPDAVAREFCQRKKTRERWLTAICVAPDGTTRAEYSRTYSGWIDLPDEPDCMFEICRLSTPFKQQFPTTIRGASGERERCAIVEVTAHDIACRSGGTTVVRAAR
jgi:hypothetical protein